jgi:indole-3-glycerol phosphate synthase
LAIAESGIRSRDDIKRLEAAGFDAFLVGETLMRAFDPGHTLAALLGRKVESSRDEASS